jgi:hypothetical protein
MQQTDRSDFEGFQSPEEREKIIIIIIARKSYTWFPFLQPKIYRRMIKYFYFISGYIQIWLNLSSDDCHFWLQTKFPKKQTLVAQHWVLKLSLLGTCTFLIYVFQK